MEASCPSTWWWWTTNPTENHWCTPHTLRREAFWSGPWPSFSYYESNIIMHAYDMNVPLLHFIDLIISWWESWCSWIPCPRPLVAWRQKACAENANVLFWPAYWYRLETSLNTKQFIESTTWRHSVVSLVFKEPPTVSQLSFHLEVKCSQTNRNCEVFSAQAAFRGVLFGAKARLNNSNPHFN